MSNYILIHPYTSLTLNSSSFFLCSSRNSLADNDGGVGVAPPPPLPPPPVAAAAEVSRGAGPSRSFNLKGNVRQEEEKRRVQQITAESIGQERVLYLMEMVFAQGKTSFEGFLQCATLQ